MTVTRRQFISATSIAFASASGSLLAQQRAYPSKSITIVVPFAPGGNIDTLGRTLSIPLGRELGQSVLVDNRGGGGGAIGTSLAARAEADGHTLLLTTTGQFATLPQMITTSYKTSDFEPICLASRTPMLLMAKKNNPHFKNIAEFIRFAKSNPRKLSAGHAGPGTINHLALLQLENAIGASINSIAYRGSGPALIDLLSGQIDVVLDQVTSSMPHIKAGTLEPLAIMAPDPDPALPSVLSLKQLNLATFDATTYLAILAPAKTPASVLALLTPALKKSIADPALEKTLKDLGSAPYFAEPDVFRNLVRTEEALSAQLLRDGRLKPE
jgi:tripartite-type tricarboxylate transporter receptor subunit TctC